MAQTSTKRRPASKAPATRKRTVTSPRPSTPLDRSKELSEDVVDSLEKAQRAAIEAVRRFVDTVDHALPALPRDEGPTRRREIVDSALDMADTLVHTQSDFVHKVIDGAGRSLSRTDGAK